MQQQKKQQIHAAAGSGTSFRTPRTLRQESSTGGFQPLRMSLPWSEGGSPRHHVPPQHAPRTSSPLASSNARSGHGGQNSSSRSSEGSSVSFSAGSGASMSPVTNHADASAVAATTAGNVLSSGAAHHGIHKTLFSSHNVAQGVSTAQQNESFLSPYHGSMGKGSGSGISTKRGAETATGAATASNGIFFIEPHSTQECASGGFQASRSRNSSSAPANQFVLSSTVHNGQYQRQQQQQPQTYLKSNSAVDTGNGNTISIQHGEEDSSTSSNTASSSNGYHHIANTYPPALNRVSVIGGGLVSPAPASKQHAGNTNCPKQVAPTLTSQGTQRVPQFNFPSQNVSNATTTNSNATISNSVVGDSTLLFTPQAPVTPNQQNSQNCTKQAEVEAEAVRAIEAAAEMSKSARMHSQLVEVS